MVKGKVVYCSLISIYMRRNVPILGFLIGLVTPLLGLFIMYLLWGQHQGIVEFVRLTFRLSGQASKVFTLSLLANILPFVFFTSKRLDYSARGVFIATMIYAMFIVLVKFVW